MHAAEGLAFLELPTEIVERVLSFCDGKTILACASVCRVLRGIASQEALWKTVCEKAFAAGKRALLRKDYADRFGWKSLFEECCLTLYPCPHILVSSMDGTISLTSPSFVFRVRTVISKTKISSRLGTQQPTFSPDGRRIAFAEYADAKGWLVIFDIASRNVVRIPVPYAPFYIYWQACSTILTYLSNWEGRQVALRVVDLLGAFPSTRGSIKESAQQSCSSEVGGDAGTETEPGTVVNAPEFTATEPITALVAAPLFYSWSPNSYSMFTHSNHSDLRIGKLVTSSSGPLQFHIEATLPYISSFYGAPQWSPDGSWLLFATDISSSSPSPSPSQSAVPSLPNTAHRAALVVASTDGIIRHRLFVFSGQITFMMNSTQTWLGYTLRGRPDRGDMLCVLPLHLPPFNTADPPTPPSTNIVGDTPLIINEPDAEVLCFYWSPSGRYLLYLIRFDSTELPFAELHRSLHPLLQLHPLPSPHAPLHPLLRPILPKHEHLGPRQLCICLCRQCRVGCKRYTLVRMGAEDAHQ